MRIKKILTSIVILLVVYFGSNKVLDILQDRKTVKNYGSAAAEKSKGQIVDKELLVLLVGVDKNPDSDDNSSDLTRTDTMMLLKINTETGKIDLLSIPRDSRIKVRDEFTKANHAHAYGGIELTLQTLRNFLGIDIDYYAEINYDAVVEIVDALDGVDYTVPEGINVKRGTYIDIKPGKNHLSGEEVLWYLRTRSIYQNGDLGRVETQQKFIKAMVDEIIKKSSQINLATLAKTYVNNVKTNIPMSVILNLLSNIDKLSSENFTTYTVPGVGQMIDGISYYIPDYEATWKIIDSVFADYKLKDWTKEDSGYMEYYNYDYSQESTDTTNTENSDQSTNQNENTNQDYNSQQNYSNQQNYNNQSNYNNQENYQNYQQNQNNSQQNKENNQKDASQTQTNPDTTTQQTNPTQREEDTEPVEGNGN